VVTQDPDTLRSRADRQAAQAWAFDRIGEHYDEAFPHKDGQVAAGEWLIAERAVQHHVLGEDCGKSVFVCAAMHAVDK